jgi:predicted N-acetyltransferase YhbS
MAGGVRIRAVGDGDWAAITAMESDAYAALGLSERRAALESKVRASPATCRVLLAGGRPAGYVLALPYPDGQVPVLDRGESAVFTSGNLHLHDLVVARSLRGQGLGGRLVRHLAAAARAQGFERISLVAVAGSAGFWSSQGFAARAAGTDVSGYGGDSVYMSMTLTPVGAGAVSPAGRPPVAASSSDEVS